MDATGEQEPSASAPALLAGRYRLGPRRGSAVDAAFFEAVDEESQTAVVVKLVHPDLSARAEVQQAFRSTMQVVADIRHPHIAAVLDFGAAEWNEHRVLYVVSEQLTGGSLRDLLDRGRLLSPSQALLVGLDACKALDALHRKGLVHGDVRPATMVFGDDRRLRLVDAGLGQVVADAVGSEVSNDVAMYASPEQAVGAPLQPASDVYALCLALLESITGRVPFAADSTVATLANRVDKLMPVSADLGAFAAVLERAGRPDPADRFTAAEFGRSLVQISERMPKPEPLPLRGMSLFDTESAAPVAPVLPVLPVAPEPDPAPEPEPVSVLPPPIPTIPPTVDVTDPDSELDDDVRPGDEFPDHPAPTATGRRWFLAVLAVMAVAGGVLAWWSAQPEEKQVPDLVGLDVAQAGNLVSGDFTVEQIDEASETDPIGVVIRTDPVAGTRVDKGSTITLVVSTGPAPRVLPELTGLSFAEALSKLEGMGLLVEYAEPVYDENVAKDIVLAWTVPDSPALVAGGTVLKGTTVSVVVSAGPAPRTVPDLTDMALADAAAALQALGLAITEAPQEFSNEIGQGRVIRQDPAPGGSVERGSTVTVAISKGQDLVNLPDLTGLDMAGVEAALAGAGFALDSVQGDPTQTLIAVYVDGVLAPPGHVAVRGAKVQLVYAPTPVPAPIPTP
jgi:serine/threonine-protein kinase